MRTDNKFNLGFNIIRVIKIKIIRVINFNAVLITQGQKRIAVLICHETKKLEYFPTNFKYILLHFCKIKTLKYANLLTFIIM